MLRYHQGLPPSFQQTCHNNYIQDCAPLGHYAASSGKLLPKFRGHLSVPPFKIFICFAAGPEITIKNIVKLLKFETTKVISSHLILSRREQITSL